MKEIRRDYQIPSHQNTASLVSALEKQGFEVNYSHDPEDLRGFSPEYIKEFLKTRDIPISFEGKRVGRICHYGFGKPYVFTAIGNQGGDRLNQFLSTFEFPESH
jgi:hypothetical protein